MEMCSEAIILNFLLQTSNLMNIQLRGGNSSKESSNDSDMYVELTSEDNLFLFRKKEWIPFELEPSIMLRVKKKVPFSGMSSEAAKSTGNGVSSKSKVR